MNNPIGPDDELESRIDKLERDMKQVKSMLGHIKLDTGDARESLDAIERRQVETNKLFREIRQVLPDHGEKLDTLEQGQQSIKQDIAAIHDVFVKDFERVENGIEATQGTQNERFDHIDNAMATKDDIKRLETDITSIKTTQEQILALLKQNRSES